MNAPRGCWPFCCVLLLALCSAIALSLRGLAMEAPPPGMIEQMKADGTYANALKFAEKLGNHKLLPPRRGAANLDTDPQVLAKQILLHQGESLDLKGAKAISSASTRELAWTELDFNHDRVVDERDVLALGLPRPKGTAAFPSLGTNRTFALLIDFEEYPSYFPREEVEKNLFSADGEPAYYYKGLRPYYEQASYGQAHMEGSVYGWHRASQPRAWYHPDDSLDYGYSWQRQQLLVEEAILAADAAGEDFSQYDNDGDGRVDYFLVIWSGPHGNWATFWWGYFGVSLPADFRVDGVQFSSYSWQWERYYGFGETPPEPEHWDPLVTIHETGHALGLPDYYDYDGSVGPDGGCGGLDIMDGTWGDHGCFSKYWLGWLSPTIAYTNLNDEPLDEASANADAVLFMPGYDPVAPWAEYFMAQNRFRSGLDIYYPNDGLLLWHVDARVNEGGGMRYNNSYTDHKLLKLMQADGLEEIENGVQGADAEDYYVSGKVLGPATTPSSDRYDGSETNATVDDISASGATMTADFMLYGSSPPSVNITNPLDGDTVSGLLNIGAGASDDGSISRMDVLVDGEQIFNTTSSASVSVAWNTLVEYNKTLEVTVRAWDDGNQMGSQTISVTVSNAGIASISDDFEAGLLKWRAQNDAYVTRGQYTNWDTRISPFDGVPTGSGNELWVRPYSSEWCNAWEFLRGQRIDTTGFTRPLQIRFKYRARSGFALEMTEDQGSSWTRLADLASTFDWQTYSMILPLQDRQFYVRLRYTGNVRESEGGGWGANIDDFVLREAPSDPPIASFSSPASGDLVGGTAVFSVNAQDDGGVDRVMFYVNGALAITDAGAPWEYSRDTIWEDNNPKVEVRAIAEDGDGLFSPPAIITVGIRNPRNFPVTDDLESGTLFWSFQNDGLNPNWSQVTDDFHSGANAIGFVPGLNPWEPNNYDGLWFSGPEIVDMRTALDLSGPDCLRPELSFWYKADQPSNGYVALYFYNTWFGWQQFSWLAADSDSSEWVKKTYDLTDYAGQSGQVVFWYFGAPETDGAGIWIDDIRLDNRGPILDAIKPSSALAGQPLRLLGSGFGTTQGGSSVQFSGADPLPADYLSWSDTEIELLVPVGAQSGEVYVSVSTGDSAPQQFKLGTLALALWGLDPAEFYRPPTGPPLTPLYKHEPQSVQLYVDGALVAESSQAPFGDLEIPIGTLTNGTHQAWITSQRLGEQASSSVHEFTVFTLQGDVNGDGSVDALDVPALIPLMGMTALSFGWKPWYDPDLDGAVTEADVSYLGYHSGESLP